MNSLFEKIKKLKAEIRLDMHRKQAIRERLVHFIEAEALVRERDVLRQKIQRPTSGIQFLIFKVMPVIAVIVLVAFVGGGTTAAAEGALPGDVLYPVKVKFNEEVRAAFTFSPEAKATWEVRRAERRLEEAAELASRGRIEAKAQGEIRAHFSSHADRIEERIRELEEKGNVRGAADLASHFETSLITHAGVLRKIKARSSEAEEAEEESLEDKVQTALDDVTGVRLDLESRIASLENGPELETAAEGKIRAAINAIASTQSFIEKKKAGVSAEARTEAEAKLKNAEDLVLEANAKIEAKLYGEAFNLGNEAIRAAQEAKAQIEEEGEVRFEEGHNASSSEDHRDQEEMREGEREEASSTTSTEKEEGIHGRIKVKLNF